MSTSCATWQAYLGESGVKAVGGFAIDKEPATWIKRSVLIDIEHVLGGD